MMTTTTWIPARDVQIGDVVYDADGTRRVVLERRPVTTTQTGRPRRRPAVQVTLESQAEDTRQLYSDTLYLDSRVRIVEPSCPACRGHQWLIVAVDGREDQLRIERCDHCSADTLTDADVERRPEAQAALAAAKGGAS